MNKRESPAGKPGNVDGVGLINASNAATVDKSFYCLELDWGGVESCNIIECLYRDRCEVQEAEP